MKTQKLHWTRPGQYLSIPSKLGKDQSLSFSLRATKHPGKKLLTQFIKYQSPEATHVCCRFAFVCCCICLLFCVLNFNSAGLSLYRFPPLHLTSSVKLYHTHMLCFESKTFFALCLVFILFFSISRSLIVLDMGFNVGLWVWLCGWVDWFLVLGNGSSQIWYLKPLFGFIETQFGGFGEFGIVIWWWVLKNVAMWGVLWLEFCLCLRIVVFGVLDFCVESEWGEKGFPCEDGWRSRVHRGCGIEI